MFKSFKEVRNQIHYISEGISKIGNLIITKFKKNSNDNETLISELKKKNEILESRLSTLESQNNELANRSITIESQLVAANAVATAIQGRLEFVREELLFEMREKNNTFKDRVEREIETKIISDEKYKDLGIRKINVGCGHIQPEGYINVDARALPGVDVTCEAGALPFNDGDLEEIYSAHLIEHFTEFELLRKIIPHWKSKLNVGGILRLVTPDAVSMMNDFSQGEMTFDDLRKVTYGSQDYEGDFHYNMFSVESLTNILIQAGFKRVELIEDNRKNGLCREMELIAIN